LGPKYLQNYNVTLVFTRVFTLVFTLNFIHSDDDDILLLKAQLGYLKKKLALQVSISSISISAEKF
jgi:hypothetical protein